MRLALPVSIPASCFFDLHDKNLKADIGVFPNWDWKISKQSLSISEHCKKNAHHTKYFLQTFSRFLYVWPYWHQVSYFHAGQICQSQLVPVSSPRVLELDFLKGVSLIFFCKQAATNSTYEEPGSLWVWNTWQQALLWLVACDVLRVSACDAQLASYMQRRPSCRGLASRPLQWVSDQKFNFCSLNFAPLTHVRQAEHWQQESWRLCEQWYHRYRFK